MRLKRSVGTMKAKIKIRDPFWKVRRALGQKIVRDRTKYSRKEKHRRAT